MLKKFRGDPSDLKDHALSEENPYSLTELEIKRLEKTQVITEETLKRFGKQMALRVRSSSASMINSREQKIIQLKQYLESLPEADCSL